MPIQYHDNLIPIKADAMIWRYMDIEKYRSFLTDKGLFFCRADKFSDPFEGSLTKAEYANRWESFGFGLHGEPVEPAKLEADLDAISALHKRLKRSTIVNCWHMNTGESDAMWRLYLKDNEGVAIQTTPRKLFEALNTTDQQIMPSMVRYLDYDTKAWYHPEEYPHVHYNLIVPLIHKRAEFAHEREFRLFIDVPDAEKNDNYWVQPDSTELKGRLITFDIGSAIEKIILPPTSNKLFDERTQGMTRELGYKFEFEKSKLGNEPFF